jgi:hypothetical protein
MNQDMSQVLYNEGRLSEAFYNSIANSRDDRILDDNKDMQNLMESSEKWADLLFQVGSSPLSEKSAIDAQIFIYKLQESHNEKLREHVEKILDEHIGKFIVKMQYIAENRFLKLIDMGQSALINVKTLEYLRRATLCYLFGLDEQCLIMCRSVLEAAFLDTVPDIDCEKNLKVAKKPRHGRTKIEYTLSDRIATLQNKSTKYRELCKEAYLINKSANELIHPDRDAHNFPLNRIDDLLKKTIQIVKELSQVKT